VNEGLERDVSPQASAVVPPPPKILAADLESEDVGMDVAPPDVAVADCNAAAMVHIDDVEDEAQKAVGCADDVLDVAVNLADEFLTVEDGVGAVRVTDQPPSGHPSTGLHG